jgi:transposase
VALAIDSLDGDQLRQAAKLLEKENERLLRQVLELRQRLDAAEGKETGQLELLAELEQQLRLRNQKLFGRSSEKRGTSKEREETAPQQGHGASNRSSRSSSASMCSTKRTACARVAAVASKR